MGPEHARIEQLEALVSRLRHDLRSAISPAALVADRLRQNADPAIQRAAATITGSFQRVLKELEATYELVPPHGGQAAGMIIGAGGRRG